jgi:RNA polymerase sigma-70 factor (ECF subfamily)
MPLPLDDNLLIQRIAQANSGALSELYDRYSRLVYSLAVYMVADAGLAEEITQDVFLQVWRKAGSYQTDLGKVTTWLTSITRHRAIDMLRRQNVRPEGSWTGLEDALDLPGENLAVEPQVLYSAQREHIRRALAALPPEQRIAVSLAYYQGLTQQEIAERLNEPLGTVKTRIRLGMQKLRQILQPEEI